MARKRVLDRQVKVMGLQSTLGSGEVQESVSSACWQRWLEATLRSH